jgi:Bacterial SH3 domain
VVAIPEPACPSCDEQNREIARLRQELAGREAELRDLRASQREQVKVIQESTREVTRAKVKLRRLATQAEAASYIAEVEVALESARASRGAATASPFLELAQAMIASTTAPFAQADYGIAMDRAAQAEQIIAIIADSETRSRSRPRVSGEVLLQVPVPLRVTVESRLRRRPRRSADFADRVRKDSPVVASAYKGSWLRVETEDGRSGWVEQSQLGAR